MAGEVGNDRQRGRESEIAAIRLRRNVCRFRLFADHQPLLRHLERHDRAAGSEVDQLLAREKVTDGVEIQIEYEPELDREQMDPRADRPLLEYLARQTGGAVLEPTTLANLHQVLALEPRTLESAQRTPLWDRWWCLGIIAGCLTVEWLLRKRAGLA